MRETEGYRQVVTLRYVTAMPVTSQDSYGLPARQRQISKQGGERTLMNSTAVKLVGIPRESTELGDDWLNDLAGRAAAGDRQAAERLLATIHPAIVRYCRARIGRNAGTFSSADDAAQEACLGIYKSLPGYQPLGHSFKAFAYRIAANKVVDHYRRCRSDKETSFDTPPEDADPTANPESRFLGRESGEYVKRLLSHVSEREREIVVLRCVVGLSAEETAQAVGSTPGAVRVAQHRALAKLRALLERQRDAD